MVKISKLNMIRALFLILVALALALVALEHSIAGFTVIAVATLVLLVIIRRHSSRALYTCARCGHNFKISPFVDFVSPHKGYEKWLQCPNCAAIVWCREV